MIFFFASDQNIVKSGLLYTLLKKVKCNVHFTQKNRVFPLETLVESKIPKLPSLFILKEITKENMNSFKYFPTEYNIDDILFTRTDNLSTLHRYITSLTHS
ncbi:unnamed protein product [Rotaria socialis]